MKRTSQKHRNEGSSLPPVQCDVVKAKGSLSMAKGPRTSSLPQLTGSHVMKDPSILAASRDGLYKSASQPGLREEKDGEDKDTGSMLRRAVFQVRAGMGKKNSTIEKAVIHLRPTLESFQHERVRPQDLSETSAQFFGSEYFEDDWFPSWLTGRKDFLTFCPRYCPDQGAFDQIADQIPRSVMVVRAMKNCKWGNDMDMHQIRHLARKSRVKEYPRGSTIFRQGDAADALYIVVKGSVSLRITQKPQDDGSPSSSHSLRASHRMAGIAAMKAAEMKGKAGLASPMSPGCSPRAVESGRLPLTWIEVAVAKEADVFGEVGLESVSAKSGESRKRAATAYCTEATIVARIPAEVYLVELKAIQAEATRRLCEWFQSGACSLINHLSRHGQIMLAKKVRSEIFGPDSTIYKEGDAAHAIFLVRRGNCVAKKTLDFKQQIRSDVNGVESKGLKFSQDADLIEFKEGDYFGEEFLVDRKDRAMRVVATRGGAELIVVLNAVADELFKVEALPAVLERWNDVMSKVQQNKNECLGNIQSQQLRRDVRLDCFGPIYQRRARINTAYVMDTVQQLLEEDGHRQVKLKRAYEKCIGQIDAQEVSVQELKRREEVGTKRRAQVQRREQQDAEDRRSTLHQKPDNKDAQDGYSAVAKQKEVVWLRKEHRKLQNAAEKDSLEEKEELHEEICDDVRSYMEKSSVENYSVFRECVQAFDKTFARRNEKAQRENKQKERAEAGEESDGEAPQEEIPMDQKIPEESPEEILESDGEESLS